MADEKIYVLIVDVAGPGWHDRIEVQDTDLEKLEPTYLDRGGFRWERYGSDEEYVEVRKDYVIARRLEHVAKTQTATYTDVRDALHHPPRRPDRTPLPEIGDTP